jgi:hypothetical protein
MWMYPGPCCPDCPFPTELGNTKINTQIQGVLSHGADQNFGSSLIPLRERVKSPRVHLLVPISASQHICILAQGLGHAHSTPWGLTLHEDATRRDTNHTYNKRLWVRR